MTISGGHARVETISMLEDLWHDFEFFKSESARFQKPQGSVSNQLIAKRHQRAALLMLVFYLEGVLYHWLKQLLPKAGFVSLERKGLEIKVEKIRERAGVTSQPSAAIAELKTIRNALVHLKPGQDLALYDKISPELLESTESSIVTWLEAMGQALGLPRHPNTETESKELRDALGIADPKGEGYTGRKAQ